MYKPYAYRLTGGEVAMLIRAMKTGLYNTKENDTESAISNVKGAYEFLMNLSPNEGGFGTQQDRDTACMQSFQDFQDQTGAD